MTFREIRALLLGYNASDRATRERILKLVPDLADLLPLEEPASRWVFTIGDIARVIVCREADLPAHKAQFAADHPYASGEVTVERLP